MPSTRSPAAARGSPPSCSSPASRASRGSSARRRMPAWRTFWAKQRRAPLRRTPATTLRASQLSHFGSSQLRKLRPRRSMLAALLCTPALLRAPSRLAPPRRALVVRSDRSRAATIRALAPIPVTGEWITTPSVSSTLASRLAAARCPTRARRSRFITPAGCRMEASNSTRRVAARRLFSSWEGPSSRDGTRASRRCESAGSGGSDPGGSGLRRRGRGRHPGRRHAAVRVRAARRQIRRRRADRALPGRADQRGGGGRARASFIPYLIPEGARPSFWGGSG